MVKVQTCKLPGKYMAFLVTDILRNMGAKTDLKKNIIIINDTKVDMRGFNNVSKLKNATTTHKN